MYVHGLDVTGIDMRSIHFVERHVLDLLQSVYLNARVLAATDLGIETIHFVDEHVLGAWRKVNVQDIMGCIVDRVVRVAEQELERKLESVQYVHQVRV